MTSWIIRALFALFVLAPAFAAEPPIVVGAVVSQSGMLADLADGYRKGLLVWQDEVNAAGGVRGRNVELRLLDDGSEAARNSALYQQLIRDDKADALIGPYGTAATLMAAAEAEKTRRVMVNGAGSSVAVHRRLPRYVFQSAVPYAAFGAGVLQIAGEQGYRSLLILARDDMVSQEMAEAARESALKQGFTVGPVETYGGEMDNYVLQVVKAINAEADAWIAFGQPRDAADMVKTLKRVGFAPKLFFARAAADPKFIELVGQDAEFSLAAAEYHPRLKTNGNDRFVKLYSQNGRARPIPRPRKAMPRERCSAKRCAAREARTRRSCARRSRRSSSTRCSAATRSTRRRGSRPGSRPRSCRSRRAGRSRYGRPSCGRRSRCCPIRSGASGSC